MFICFFTCMSEACMVAHAMAADRQTSGIMGEKKPWFASLQVTEFFFTTQTYITYQASHRNRQFKVQSKMQLCTRLTVSVYCFCLRSLQGKLAIGTVLQGHVAKLELAVGVGKL